MAEHVKLRFRSMDRRSEANATACARLVADGPSASVGGWTKTRPGSLGLLPSGPDPVGERYVLRQPPAAYVDHEAAGRKRRAPLRRLVRALHAALSSSSTMACAIRAVALSAGNSISSASSESVTSFGVPKTVTVPRKDMTPKRVATRNGVASRSAGAEALRRFAFGRGRIGRDLGEQALDNRIAPRVELLTKHAQHMGAPRAIVHDPRPHAGRMQGEAHGVDRREHEIGRTALVKLGQGGIRHDDIPVPVDGEGGIGLVRLKNGVDRGFRRVQRRERALLIRGGEARRQKKPFWSRSGISRHSARRAIISRLGCALPVSRQERCRVELSAA